MYTSIILIYKTRYLDNTGRGYGQMEETLVEMRKKHPHTVFIFAPNEFVTLPQVLQVVLLSYTYHTLINLIFF